MLQEFNLPRHFRPETSGLPTERRSEAEGKSVMKEYLESIAVFVQLSTFFLAPLLSAVITSYLLFCTSLWPAVLLYIVWIYFDRETSSTTGRSRKCMRNSFLWKEFRDYFPQRLVKTAELDSASNHMLCFFPHGILATSLLSHMSNDTSPVQHFFPGCSPFLLTLDLNFYIPFFREITMSYGTKSVSKKSIIYQLSGTKGKLLSMYPGGSAEAAKSQPGTYRVAIKSRKGFVKLAIATGSNLVPVIAFGETDLYEHKIPTKGTFAEKMFVFLRKKTGVAFCNLSGCGFLKLMPFRKPVTAVVGKPLIIKKNENATSEDVDRVHAEFLQSLEALFEEHKKNYVANPESTFLSIED